VEPTNLSQYFLSATVIAPLVFALMFPLVKERDGGKNIHLLAFTFATFFFLFTLLPWCPQFALSATDETYKWFPKLGVNFALGADGLSWMMVVLTSFLVWMAVIASKTNITKRLKMYYSMLFVLTSAILGVFLARDLFLFFLFWELELIPMYFLIAIWGGPRRDYAAMKFVLYTLFGSVFLVAALLGIFNLMVTLGQPTDTIFLFSSLASVVQGGQVPVAFQVLLFTGFFITFAVKLPMVPFHTWLPDAHVEAPTPISMLLAGILLKMGAYGMLRLCFGMFPQAAELCAPTIALLAFINIVYTAGVALVQTDLKKLIAYSSVSHMGFVLLGLAALNNPGYQGAVFVMISHGIVSAALFMCVGTLYLRTHTRTIAEYGGFGSQTPIIFYFFMLMAMASLGLPLLISFPGESLVFYGAFLSKTHALGSTPFLQWNILWTMKAFTILSAIGVILGAAYLLWMLKKVFFGPISDKWKTLQDATFSEIAVLSVLSLFVIYFGLNPQWLIAKYDQDVTGMLPQSGVAKMISQQTSTTQGTFGGAH
jgi:NADH-quinone oxidoreductase subunit M